MSKKDSSRFDDLFSAARSREPKKKIDLEDESKPRKSKSTDPSYARTTIYLPKTLHRKLKAAAAVDGAEMSEIVAMLVEQWLENRDI